MTVIRILPVALSQFVDVFQRVQGGYSPRDPEYSIKRILRSTAHFFENYFISTRGRYVFEIKDGVVESVCPAFSLSKHAKQRCIERFGMFFVGEENILIPTFEIMRGKHLSQNDLKKLRITVGSMAILFEDRIYVINELFCTVVTVISKKDIYQ